MTCYYVGSSSCPTSSECEDGGFSLPDMLLVRQSAFTASFFQCLSNIIEHIINLIHPFNLIYVNPDYIYFFNPSAVLPTTSSLKIPKALKVPKLLSINCWSPTLHYYWFHNHPSLAWSEAPADAIFTMLYQCPSIIPLYHQVCPWSCPRS